MKLWLVRHAQPLIGNGICYGRLDMPADAGATAECARQLAALLPAGLPVLTSPLQRCEQLAHALYAQRPDLAYKIDARLREMDFGNWEGRPWDAIGPAALDAWVADFALHRPGGGESVRDFMRRVAGLWDEACGAACATGRGMRADTDMLWITHAGVMRAATLLQRGQRHIARADQWPGASPGFGQWRVLALPGEEPDEFCGKPPRAHRPSQA